MQYLKYKDLFDKNKKPRYVETINLDKQTLVEIGKLKKLYTSKKASDRVLKKKVSVKYGKFLCRIIFLHDVKENIVSVKNSQGNIWTARLQILDKNENWIHPPNDIIKPNDTVGCNGYFVVF